MNDVRRASEATMGQSFENLLGNSFKPTTVIGEAFAGLAFLVITVVLAPLVRENHCRVTVSQLLYVGFDTNIAGIIKSQKTL